MARDRRGKSRAGRRAFRPALGELEPRLVMATGVTLSPPWVTFRNELANTIGKTPGVLVSPLVRIDSGHYAVAVSTANLSRGVALATVLDDDHNFGGVDVRVLVTDLRSHLYSPQVVTTSSQVANLERTALAGNPLFQKVVVHPLFPGQPDVVFPIFSKSVVQFPNDNLADAYRNFNAVAAAAFGDVLSGEVGNVTVDPSTASPAATSATGPTLSPPWETFRSELIATVGKTPGVFISSLVQLDGSHYVVAVATPNAQRGVSFATILNGDHDFGGVHVQVISTDYAGNHWGTIPVTSANQLATLERIALAGNPLFKTVVVKPIFPGQPPTVFPIFTKSVIQFFDDNLADAYGNFNAVAAAGFADVILGRVGGFDVSPSTSTT